VVSLKEKSNGQEESEEKDRKKDHQEENSEESPQEEDREKEEEIMSTEQSLLARLCRLRASDAVNYSA
jgi:hypothetical protein